MYGHKMSHTHNTPGVLGTLLDILQLAGITDPLFQSQIYDIILHMCVQ